MVISILYRERVGDITKDYHLHLRSTPRVPLHRTTTRRPSARLPIVTRHTFRLWKILTACQRHTQITSPSRCLPQSAPLHPITLCRQATRMWRLRKTIINTRLRQCEEYIRLLVMRKVLRLHILDSSQYPAWVMTHLRHRIQITTRSTTKRILVVVRTCLPISISGFMSAYLLMQAILSRQPSVRLCRMCSRTKSTTHLPPRPFLSSHSRTCRTPTATYLPIET